MAHATWTLISLLSIGIGGFAGPVASLRHASGSSFEPEHHGVAPCERCLTLSQHALRGDQRARLRRSTLHELSRLREQIYCKDARPFRKYKDLPERFIWENDTLMLKVSGPPNVYLGIHDNSTRDWMSAAVHRDGVWEKGIQDLLVQALETEIPGAEPTSLYGKALFVDIGANMGSLSIPTAAKGYEVIAFEAMWDNARRIRGALCASGTHISSLYTLHPFGLGNATQRCHIIAAEENWGNGIAVCGATDEADALRKAKISGSLTGTLRLRDSFDMMRLDDVLQRDIHALKIDVEGYEPMVFEGAQRLLREYNVWFITIEFNLEFLRASLHGRDERPVDHVLKLLKLGYKVSTHSFFGPYEEDAQSKWGPDGPCSSCNIYFTKKRD